LVSIFIALIVLLNNLIIPTPSLKFVSINRTPSTNILILLAALKNLYLKEFLVLLTIVFLRVSSPPLVLTILKNDPN